MINQPPPSPFPERELLLAAQGFATAIHPGYKLESVNLRLKAPGGVFVSLAVMKAEPPRPKLAAAILDALRLAESPLRSKVIARAIGRKPTSYIRQTICNLVTEGELVKVKGGYWLASRQQPESENRRPSPASS